MMQTGCCTLISAKQSISCGKQISAPSCSLSLKQVLKIKIGPGIKFFFRNPSKYDCKMPYDREKYRTPTGLRLTCKGWVQEAALRMLLNNLNPEVAERPDDLIVYGGRGKAA